MLGVATLAFFGAASAKHFRGGHVSWTWDKSAPEDYTVKFHVRAFMDRVQPLCNVGDVINWRPGQQKLAGDFYPQFDTEVWPQPAGSPIVLEKDITLVVTDKVEGNAGKYCVFEGDITHTYPAPDNNGQPWRGPFPGAAPLP
eukprot:gene2783-3404_t